MRNDVSALFEPGSFINGQWLTGDDRFKVAGTFCCVPSACKTSLEVGSPRMSWVRYMARRGEAMWPFASLGGGIL